MDSRVVLDGLEPHREIESMDQDSGVDEERSSTRSRDSPLLQDSRRHERTVIFPPLPHAEEDECATGACEETNHLWASPWHVLFGELESEEEHDRCAEQDCVTGKVELEHSVPDGLSHKCVFLGRMEEEDHGDERGSANWEVQIETPAPCH